MLQATAPERAIEYFLQIYDSIPGLDEMMQLAVIELIRKESRSASTDGALKVSFPLRDVVVVLNSEFFQAKFIKCIFELLSSGAHSVKYEAATALTTLTQNPAAVKGMSQLNSPTRPDAILTYFCSAQLLLHVSSLSFSKNLRTTSR